jgi:hypothetical protein
VRSAELEGALNISHDDSRSVSGDDSCLARLSAAVVNRACLPVTKLSAQSMTACRISVTESTGALTAQSMIEPGLRPASPKNGNIRGVSQRLSPNSVLIPENREHRDGTPNCKSPLLAGLSATIGAFSLSPGLLGWRRSADRARLHAISLLSGSLTGNFVILGHLETAFARESTVLQPLVEQFPTQFNREIISRNRDF